MAQLQWWRNERRRKAETDRQAATLDEKTGRPVDAYSTRRTAPALSVEQKEARAAEVAAWVARQK